jgi:transcriptional regulator with XRE-family HTH domain
MTAPEGIRAYVSQRIREIRNGFGSTGLSQEVLAAKLGVATNTISRWETGTYEPTLDDLETLARELGVSILEFFPKVDPTDKKNKGVDALLRTAQKLDAQDLEELRRYAEFRRARSIYSRKSAGRKRK